MRTIPFQPLDPALYREKVQWLETKSGTPAK